MSMGLTPSPPVRAILHCVLMIPLVVLVTWGLEFLYQQESSPNVTFLLSCSHQCESSKKVVDSLKCFGAQIPDFTSKFKNHFFSYSHGLTLPHPFRPLSLHPQHDLPHSNWIHP